MAPKSWHEVCAETDILMHAGACALVDGAQVAVFRTRDGLFALDNRDPKGGANVLSRGIVGDLGGRLVVASPLYKHHYDLRTGACLEDEAVSVSTWPVRTLDGRVLVGSNAAPAHAAVPGARRRRLVVIGNGMAGVRALDELVALAPDLYDITVFGAEPRTGYDRVALSGLLSGEKSLAEVESHGRDWYASRGITLHTGDPVVAIDRARRRVRSARGLECRYDRLLLATGSAPIALDVPGATLPGVVSFRDLADVETMLAVARRGGRAVVIGGGLLGLEAAAGLSRRGMDVVVVHNCDTLMNRQLDGEASGLLRATMEARGIRFRTGVRTSAILGSERASAVLLDDGSRLSADLVVTAIGVRPNIDLAARAGLRCERGILVDDTMQTFDPAVWAIGECVQHRRATFGLVAPLWEQARVCATHLAERGTARYAAPLPSAHLKVNGIHVFSAGDLEARDGAESLVLRDRARGVYKRVVLEGGVVRGAVLYGDVADGAWYCELMRDGRDVSAIRETLLFGAGGSAAP